MTGSIRRGGRAVEATVVAVHALHIIAAAELLGLSGAQLLAAGGLDREQLADPTARIPLAQLIELIEQVRTASGEPGLGLILGMRARVTSHGYVGFGVLAAQNLRQAIEFTCRYAPLRSNVIQFSLEERAGTARIWVHELMSLGSARDVVLLALAAALWQTGNALTGQQLKGDLELVIPEPAYLPRFSEGAPGEMRFDMPANALVFDARYLDLPLMDADETSFRLACETCERELIALSPEHTLTARVQALLQDERACAQGMPEAARALGVSERTLKRKLAEQGTSFSELLAEARKQHALRLLHTESSLQAVAERLGYTDPTNFARAFRRWTGRTPSIARRDRHD